MSVLNRELMNKPAPEKNAQQITRTDAGVQVLAPAKINLTLLIAGKRPDGFHNIETIMAKIDLYDRVLIERSAEAGLQLACEGPCWAPQNEDNLVYKAANTLLRNCGRSENLRLTLTKNIPAGTGLGSASSDAAATLLGVNSLLQLNLSRNALKHVAAGLGSDVPFFLDGPLALCTGRGEKIEKLRQKFNFRALLILPDVSVSTKKVYENYRHDPAIYEQLSGRIRDYLSQNRIDLAAKMCVNMLRTSCYELCEDLGRLEAKLKSLGIRPLALSGSGSAMFCLMERTDEKQAGTITREVGGTFDLETLIVRNNPW